MRMQAAGSNDHNGGSLFVQMRTIREVMNLKTLIDLRSEKEVRSRSGRPTAGGDGADDESLLALACCSLAWTT